MELISPEELKYFNSLPGETIGTGLLEDKKFIQGKEGKEGLEKLNSELKKIGCTSFDEIKHAEWYPVGCNLLSYVLAQRIFNWNDETLQEMGRYSPTVSMLMRSMTKYFLSPRRVFNMAPSYWKKFYTVGELEALEFNEKEKYCFFLLKNFPGHQVFCRHMEGVIEQVASFAGVEGLKCKEERCELKNGGNGHLFKLTWEK